MKPSEFTRMLMPKFGALLLTMLSCQFVLGATVNQEKERLAELQKNLATQEQKILSIQTEMKSLPAEIAKAQEAANRAESDLQTEQKLFEQAKAEHASAPTESTERQLRLAEIKAGVAATKLRSETRDLEKLQSKADELKANLASTEAAVKSSQTQIRRQEQRVTETIELARQQELEAAQSKASPKIVAVQPVIEPPKREILKVEKPEPIAVAAVSPPQPNTPTDSSNLTVTLSESEYKQFQFAKEQMTATEQLVNEAKSKDQAVYDDLSLTGTNINEVAFTYLGNQQYRADTKLPQGRQSFRIRGLKFQLDIPASNNNQEYVFLVDARDKNDLKASYFRKELLSYLNKNVVLEEQSVAIAKTKTETEKQEEYDAAKVAKQRLADAEAIAAAASTNDQPNHTDMQLSGSDIETADFSYLGNQQYRVDVTLPSGRQSFRVKGLRFQLDIPESNKAEEYVFIVDAREKNDLEASYFKKDLLSYDEKDMAATQ